MSAKTITHTGIVDSVGNHTVRVRILQSAACGSCSAAKLCRSSEQKEKMIDVVTNAPNKYRVGQEVTIVGSVSQGLKATLWAYVLPLILMLFVMVSVSLSGAGDALVAIAGLSVLCSYYSVLYLLRGKMEEKLAFKIENINN